MVVQPAIVPAPPYDQMLLPWSVLPSRQPEGRHDQTTAIYSKLRAAVGQGFSIILSVGQARAGHDPLELGYR